LRPLERQRGFEVPYLLGQILDEHLVFAPLRESRSLEAVEVGQEHRLGFQEHALLLLGRPVRQMHFEVQIARIEVPVGEEVSSLPVVVVEVGR